MQRFLSAILFLATLFLSGCYTVPETGRSSLMMVGADEEARLGATEFANMRSTQPVSRDPAANARVQRIGRRIANVVGSDLPSAQWEFVVFDGPTTVNAFVLPGGKVGVYTGLLNLCENDAEVAAVIGHEIAHVTARHGAERMSQSMLAGMLAVGAQVASENSSNRDMWRLAYGGAATLTILAYSRSHESEADYIGIRYAAKAGYDPRAAISFWQKMAAANPQAGGNAGKVNTWISTHPSNAQRIADLQAAMPAVLPLYEAAKPRFQ